MDKDMQPVMVTDKKGTKTWQSDHKLHRTDGPAIEWLNGDKFWLVRDRFHRTDGPALERTNGDYGWYLNDVYLTFDQWLDQNTELTDEEKVMMKLKYG